MDETEEMTMRDESKAAAAALAAYTGAVTQCPPGTASMTVRKRVPDPRTDAGWRYDDPDRREERRKRRMARARREQIVKRNAAVKGSATATARRYLALAIARDRDYRQPGQRGRAGYQRDLSWLLFHHSVSMPSAWSLSFWVVAFCLSSCKVNERVASGPHPPRNG
jgi:hypothetical protein